MLGRNDIFVLDEIDVKRVEYILAHSKFKNADHLLKTCIEQQYLWAAQLEKVAENSRKEEK